MADTQTARRYLSDQLDHWTSAAARLGRLEDLAGREAWRQLEAYLGLSLRRHLTSVVDTLVRRGALLRATLDAAATGADLAAARRQILAFRRQYLRAETTIDFYADAINTRTSPVQGALLRACDTIAHRSMSLVLDPLGHDAPATLTYIDKGLGASILKAGLRLWDGGALSPVASIKIVRHNLERPTAIVHETGHQIAHILGWNAELARALESSVPAPAAVARIWGGWASEIAADAVAFVHTGFGSVRALHDVVAGDVPAVFHLVPGDPHPMSFLRVELGIAMCRLAWGAGPWDGLSSSWREMYPLRAATALQRALVEVSLSVLPDVARLTLSTPAVAFRGRSLIDVVPPGRVSPGALDSLQQRLGPALFTSSHWIWTECLRLLAISALGRYGRRGYATPADAAGWMLRLGGLPQAA